MTVQNTPLFKYNIKMHLVARKTEVRELMQYLRSRGIEMSAPTLSKYINMVFDSEASIPSDVLREIAKFFGVPMEALYNVVESEVA